VVVVDRPSRRSQPPSPATRAHRAPTQVVYGHLDDPENQEIERGVSYLKLRPGKEGSEGVGP